jgi:ribosome biogenesis GTPase
MTEPNSSGLIVARHRRSVTVEDPQRNHHLAMLKGRELNPVVGDQVAWAITGDRSAVVNRIEPRSSELLRLNKRGAGELIAANVTQLVVVIAAEPPPAPGLIDRYLGGAAVQNIKALVLANKADLGRIDPALVEEYDGLGYGHLTVSAKTGSGLSELNRCLDGHTSVLVGQSGVGKSSLTNALIHEADQPTKTLSEKSGQGRHTTSTAKLFHLRHGGRLIDAPGVRDYAPYLQDEREIQRAFIEIQLASEQCRFNDCRHDQEPGCAVAAGIATGTISQRRYESFQNLVARHKSLKS